MASTSASENGVVGAVHLTRGEIAARVAQLGAEIGAAYDDFDPILIAPLKSSVVFLADLTRALRIPHTLDVIELAPYTGGQDGAVRLLKDVDAPLEGRHVLLVEDVAQAERLQVPDPSNLAYATQTTLSVDDTTQIVSVLRHRFPAIQGPKMEDICYATTNRQEVVKKVAPLVEAMVVVGSPNSSNTQRLKEVAERAGCPRAALVQRAKEIDWSVFGAIASLGVTAGASAPEVLVEEVIGAFAERYVVNVETVTTADEDMFFPLPRVLRGTEAAE